MGMVWGHDKVLTSASKRPQLQPFPLKISKTPCAPAIFNRWTWMYSILLETKTVLSSISNRNTSISCNFATYLVIVWLLSLANIYLIAPEKYRFWGATQQSQQCWDRLWGIWTTFGWVIISEKITQKFARVSNIWPFFDYLKNNTKWPPVEAVLRLRSKLSHGLIPYLW